MKVVVFDAMGVLYRYGDVQGRVLIPYLRAQGCHAPEQDIREAYRATTLGRLTTDGFWAAVGLTARDEHYCQEHRLTEGTLEALDELADAGLEAACLSNDTAAWSALVRRRFGLERRIRRWFISSDLRVRKPDPVAYEAVLDALNVPAGQIVFVDDRPVNLAPARALGMRTVLFRSDDTDAHPAPGSPHEVGSMRELVAAVRRIHRPMDAGRASPTGRSPD
ncbi:HAD-IA family hydrolase [Nonomuraea sp. NPDC046802]|uniref:HAD family hydrolase n=1 Tax=Nonomuraea sp. NPDC046802 TaxID=3154919 RepID=UPI00340AAB94